MIYKRSYRKFLSQSFLLNLAFNLSIMRFERDAKKREQIYKHFEREVVFQKKRLRKSFSKKKEKSDFKKIRKIKLAAAS